MLPSIRERTNPATPAVPSMGQATRGRPRSDGRGTGWSRGCTENQMTIGVANVCETRSISKLDFSARLGGYVKAGDEQECWPFQGRPTKSGYGRLCFGKRNRVFILTHRAAFELYWGEIPDGLL